MSKPPKRAERDADAEKAIIKHLMSRPDGRRYLFLQLESARVFASTFSSNALEMAFHEGERNVGLRLLASINRHAPDLYASMVAEANTPPPPSPEAPEQEELPND